MKIMLLQVKFNESRPKDHFPRLKMGFQGQFRCFVGEILHADSFKTKILLSLLFFFHLAAFWNFYGPHIDQWRTRNPCTGCFLGGKVGFGGHFCQNWSILEKKMWKIEVEGRKDHFLGLPRPFWQKKPRVQPFFSVFLKFQVLLTFSPYFTKKNLWWG